MKKTILFYVHDMHGHSVITSKQLAEKFGDVEIEKLEEGSELERDFIKVCDKEFPNLGVTEVRARIIEERCDESVKVEVVPVRYYLMRTSFNYIKERVVDNHSMITISISGDKSEKERLEIIHSDSQEFELDGVMYQFKTDAKIF